MSSGRRNNEWDRDLFAEWLRVARARKLPRMSQREVAEALGVPQTLVSRWENPTHESINPPTLKEVAILVDMFGGDFLELARMTGQWDDALERRVLVAVATGGAEVSERLRNAGVPQSWVDRPIPTFGFLEAA
ncbi:MAG TPA: helix-turn-helix transcriptional regulator [Acidimicrobiia bacterium]